MSKYDALAAEIVRRLDMGASYGQLSAALKINKGTLFKIVARQRRNAGREVNVVRVRERKFVKGLAEGLTQTEAARQAGVPKRNAKVWASRAIRRDRIFNDFHRMLAKKGLTEEYLAERHMELLRAMKTIVVPHDGQLRKLETPDNRARGKALELGWGLYGRRQESAVPVTNQQLAILIGLPRAKPICLPPAKPCDEPAETDPIDVTPEVPDLDFPE